MKATQKTIAILGCGWLGLPLAEHLIHKGHPVKGSTTSPEKLEILRSRFIEPFLINLQAGEITGDLDYFLSEVELLIIDFPPGIRRQPAQHYEDSIRELVRQIRSYAIKRIVCVSSISVYEDSDLMPVYTEEDIPNATSSRGIGLQKAEELLISESGFATIILRLGGLIGGDRHPVHQLSGRTGIANPEAPVNLIHRTDCIGIIEKLIQKEKFGEVYNAVHPEHPQKREYYQQKALEKGLPLIGFSSEASKGKLINPEKLIRELDYRFTEKI